VLKGRYQYFTQAEMKKIKAAGYSAEPTSLEEGVRRYVRDYLAGGAGGLTTR
jgi:ADP-L-glycero-D-manno-heptose 6-epimerase